MHAVPSAPVYPAMHLQPVKPRLPDSEKVLAGQSVHDAGLDAPKLLLYLLLPHSIHVTLLVAPNVSEYVDMGHRVHVSAPSPECVPVGQGVHVDDPTAE